VLFRLFLLSTLFFINLYACKGGYTSCVAKVKDSHAVINSTLSIPILHNQRLIYSLQKPDAKILKYDPFLSLYLIKDAKPFAYPFDINMRLQLGTAMVNSKRSCEGKFLINQVGLNHLATYSEPLIIPSLLTSSCCSLEGIVTPHGIIQKEYLKHFVTTKSIDYGDIGVRLQNKQGVVVSASDPFFKKNPFKRGDYIVSFDGKSVTAASVVMRKILFSKIGTQHNVKVKRASKYLTLRVVTQKRYGGGALSDTFLESQGLYFDTSLHLLKIEKRFKQYGLQKGDRLIQVNGMLVKNQKALRLYLQMHKDYSSLLFERNGFQFFVNIK
jgi:hypothetical protein